MIYRNVVMTDPDMSRRKLLDAISIAFARAGDCAFRFRGGRPYAVPDIDAVFGNDCDMRWLSHYLEGDGSGDYPKRMSRKPERLRLLHLYLKLRYPRFIPHLDR